MPPIARRPATRTWLERRWPTVLVAAALAWYLLATLPFLADFPVMEWAQMRIVEPAYKLATRGIYGNDLLTGFYNAENRYYEFMPLYPLLVSGAFKLLGAGIWQARVVSVLGGLLVLVLTYRLGGQLVGPRIGALAAAALVLLRLGLPVPGEAERIGLDLNASGIPLLDLARVVRFDIWVPVWVLAACSAFVWAYPRRSRAGLLVAGVLAGLATLTHLYGAFILAVFGVLVLWEHGWRAWRRPALWLLAVGWLLALLPWGAYVLGDLDAYRGQMLKHEGHFAVLDPSFYLGNVLREPWRYLAWLGGSFRHPILWPRVGIWVLLAGVIVAMVFLSARTRRGPALAERLLLLAWPVLAALLALLIMYKRYYYVLLVLPFLALQMAYAIEVLWREPVRRPALMRGALIAVLAAAVVEGGYGVARSLQLARAATPYRQLTAPLAAAIPRGARVLLAEPYWLGLTDSDARSIQLAFLFAERQYYPQAPPLEVVLAEMRPDFVVTEERLLETYARNEEAGSQGRPEWKALDGYLRAHCPEVVATEAAPDYGPVRVYRCRGGGASGARPAPGNSQPSSPGPFPLQGGRGVNPALGGRDAVSACHRS